MNVVLGASAFCNWNLAQPVLLKAGLMPGPQVQELSSEQALQELVGQLASNPAAAVVVFYSPLQLALEQASALGVPPEQAVTQWQQNAVQLIRFCKQQRARVLLVNLAEVLAAPQAFALACSRRWPSLAVDATGFDAPAFSPAPFYELLARHLLAGVAALQPLAQQLTALAQPLAEQEPALPDLNSLVADYRAGIHARHQLPQATTQLAEARNELASLKLQLQQEQSALGQSQQEYRSLQESTQQQAAAYRQQLAEQGEENNLLLNQLHQVQAELESRLLAHEQHVAEHAQERQALQNQLAQQQQALAEATEKHRQQVQALQLQLKKEQQALADAAQKHKQQAQALQQQLKKEQQALADAAQKHQQQLAELQKETNTQAEANTKLQADLRNQQQENALILEQLFVVQQTLEAHLPQATPQAAVEQKEPAPAQPKEQQRPESSDSVLKRQLQKRANQRALKRKAAELYNSEWFDAKWYLAQYPDVAADKHFGKNPALHYLKMGGFEGRNPGPSFNSARYLALNPDVKAAGFNPLLHYLRFGQAENRRTR